MPSGWRTHAETRVSSRFSLKKMGWVAQASRSLGRFQAAPPGGPARATVPSPRIGTSTGLEPVSTVAARSGAAAAKEECQPEQRRRARSAARQHERLSISSSAPPQNRARTRWNCLGGDGLAVSDVESPAGRSGCAPRRPWSPLRPPRRQRVWTQAARGTASGCHPSGPVHHEVYLRGARRRRGSRRRGAWRRPGRVAARGPTGRLGTRVSWSPRASSACWARVHETSTRGSSRALGERHPRPRRSPGTAFPTSPSRHPPQCRRRPSSRSSARPVGRAASACPRPAARLRGIGRQLQAQGAPHVLVEGGFRAA